MIEAMTQAHWIAVAIGAVSGVLTIYLLIRLARREVPAVNQPFETNGEADLMPRATGESFADVKDTF